MKIFCLLSAFLALIVGALELSRATLGVGGIGAACFWGILARMAQAESDTKRLLAAINQRQGTPPAVTIPPVSVKPAPLPAYMR